MTTIKIILSLFVFGLFSIQCYGQDTCDITKNYNSFIKVQKYTSGNEDFIVKRIVQVNEKRCYSNLVNKSQHLLSYLLTNFTSNTDYEGLLKLKDSLALNKTYIFHLEKDSLFNSLMIDFSAKTIQNSEPKDTINVDDLLNIAVKYFSIVKLTDDGYYAGKVCAGLNDIKKTETKRKPFVEAFCFSSILKHYQSKEFNMYGEFVKAIDELNKVNLGIDREERLLRAQGAMFLIMRNNENLKRMLLKEYEENKNFLPFVIF